MLLSRIIGFPPAREQWLERLFENHEGKTTKCLFVVLNQCFIEERRTLKKNRKPKKASAGALNSLEKI
jgi:hypothetical protein